MIPKYVPISRAKSGEFEAYRQLDKSVKNPFYRFSNSRL